MKIIRVFVENANSWATPSQNSDSGSLRLGQGICILKVLPGNSDAGDEHTTLWEN